MNKKTVSLLDIAKRTCGLYVAQRGAKPILNEEHKDAIRYIRCQKHESYATAHRFLQANGVKAGYATVLNSMKQRKTRTRKTNA